MIRQDKYYKMFKFHTKLYCNERPKDNVYEEFLLDCIEYLQKYIGTVYYNDYTIKRIIKYEGGIKLECIYNENGSYAWDNLS